MKTTRIIYWTSTISFAMVILFSSFKTLTTQEMVEAFKHLGFNSDVFRIELGIGKIIGGLLLVFTFIKGRLKEWVYAGFSITLISASVAHYGANDPIANIVTPLVFLAILLVSYFSYHKLNSEKKSKTLKMAL